MASRPARTAACSAEAPSSPEAASGDAPFWSRHSATASWPSSHATRSGRDRRKAPSVSTLTVSTSAPRASAAIAPATSPRAAADANAASASSAPSTREPPPNHRRSCHFALTNAVFSARGEFGTGFAFGTERAFAPVSSPVLSAPSPPSPSLASHSALAFVFPQTSKTRTSAPCSQARTSRTHERTLETCVPICLCAPPHSMQSVTPRFRLAHSGSAAPQSAHAAFPGGARTRAKTASGSAPFFFNSIAAASAAE